MKKVGGYTLPDNAKLAGIGFVSAFIGFFWTVAPDWDDPW